MNETMKLVKEIKEGLSQRSSSQKDEIKVMQTMLNDKEYVVDVYGATGKIGTYSPSADARKMASTIIASTAKISKEEAELLADDHEFSRQEAASMIGIGKEFINTYVETGRKLHLGGREQSNVSLLGKEVEPSVSRYPKKLVDANGTASYESAVKKVPAHKTIKSSGPCPTWII